MKPPDIDDRTTWPKERSEPWTQMRADGPEAKGCREWSNDKYWVTATRVDGSPFGKQPMIRLDIQCVNQTARHDWREFQQIKNDVCGPEAEAVELYPAESRLLDPSNYYMLWVFPSFTIPLGVFDGRRVIDAIESTICQRAFAEEPAL